MYRGADGEKFEDVIVTFIILSPLDLYVHHMEVRVFGQYTRRVQSSGILPHLLYSFVSSIVNGFAVDTNLLVVPALLLPSVLPGRVLVVDADAHRDTNRDAPDRQQFDQVLAADSAEHRQQRHRHVVKSDCRSSRDKLCFMTLEPGLPHIQPHTHYRVGTIRCRLLSQPRQSKLPCVVQRMFEVGEIVRYPCTRR